MNGPMAVYLRAPSRCQAARRANWLPRNNVCEGRSFYQEITAFEEAVERLKSAYLERIGRLECQHYLMTGRCKFGPACNFYHPEYSVGITGRYQFNVFGYPLRPNVKDGSYYLRTGQCKFSGICIFNHPEPSNLMLMTTPGQQLYPEGLTYYIANSHWQDPSIYGQLIISQGLVQFPCWNPFSENLHYASPPKSQQQNSWNHQFVGTSLQSRRAMGSSDSFSSFQFGSFDEVESSFKMGGILPMRSGQPECKYFLQTGDCNFKSRADLFLIHYSFNFVQKVISRLFDIILKFNF